MGTSRRSVAIAVLIVLGCWSGVAADNPSPPPQPSSGPGGSTYVNGAMTQNGPYFVGSTGNPALRYFLYEPADPAPSSAPVVLFLHGFNAVDPFVYQSWIEHIVRKGYVVVWVQYQEQGRRLNLTLPRNFEKNAASAWIAALGRLQTSTHVRPARDASGQMLTGIVGHSLGGFLSAVLAARAADPLNGMPAPFAVVAIEPGGLDLVPSADFGAILPETKLLVVIGDEDGIVCSRAAVNLWETTAQIPDANRDFLLALSDRRGRPAQIANHFFPAAKPSAPTTVDARDFFITYKLSVAALNCAFEGSDCSYAFGDGAPEQLDMGLWSDEVPVVPLVWVEDPAQVHPTCQTPGRAQQRAP